MNAAQLAAFRNLYTVMAGHEPQDWQWIGKHMSQRMFGITEARAKAYAERHGGCPAVTGNSTVKLNRVLTTSIDWATTNHRNAGAKPMNTLINENLEALFGIELDGSYNAAAATADVSKALCHKCHGRGNFIGYSGRVVGKCFACDGTGLSAQAAGKPDNSAEINVTKIAAAFATARANKIKSPKLRLGHFTFSRAPDTGKNPGAIYVKQGEQYLGKVLGEAFFPARDCTTGQKADVVAIASDPAASAKAYGFRTGSCSCCGRELTNKDSIELGIGPICAEKYGW